MDNTRSQKVDTAKEAEYPFRNKAVATLYQGCAVSVMEEIRNRSFVDYLIKVYQEGYGFTLPAITGIEWKYAFETLAVLLDKAGINPDAGIRIDCCKMMNQEFLVVNVVSEDSDGKCYDATITMLSWEKMNCETDGMVRYTDYDHSLSVKCPHPSRMTGEYLEIVTKGLITLEIEFSEDMKSEVKPCVLFYDAALKDDTDIVSKCDDKLISAVPAFYADDTDKLCDYIRTAAKGTNGKAILRRIINMEKEYGISDQWGISNELRYIADEIEGCVTSGEKALITLSSRKAKGNEDFLNYLLSEFDKEKIRYAVCRNENDCNRLTGGKTLTLYYDFIPHSIDTAASQVNVIMADEYALTSEKKQLAADHIRCARDGGVKTAAYKLSEASGYADRGGGNNWLIRNLTLGDPKAQPWLPEKYPIKVVKGTDEFTTDKGIVHIVLSDAFRYNEEDDTVNASDEERIRVYKQSTEGINGAELFIADSKLREHIISVLKADEDEASWRGAFAAENEISAEKVVATVKDNRSNTSLYNMYKGIAIDAIGIGAWKKMAEESQDWLVSAMMSYNDMKNTDPLMDFSGVTLMVSKTFETELSNRWGAQYENYMKKKYGDKVLDYLPEALIDTDKYGNRKIMSVNKLTLGSIPFIMGLETSGRIKSEREYNEFKKFGKDELFVNVDKMDDVIHEIVDIVYYVRVNYRNKSAHKDAIDIVVATECIEYCVTEKRKLGYLMDQVRK